MIPIFSGSYRQAAWQMLIVDNVFLIISKRFVPYIGYMGTTKPFKAWFPLVIRIGESYDFPTSGILTIIAIVRKVMFTLVARIADYW